MQRAAGLLLGSVLLLMPHTNSAQLSGEDSSSESTNSPALADTRAAPPARERVGIWFQSNPFVRPDTVVEGAALDRLAWQASPPAFAGDRPGSLTALYDANEPAGLFGFALPRTFNTDDAFTAGAVFIIEPDGFAADPDGFFQISWGLWNSATTGLERTGTFTDFATDTFDLIELDFFPNLTAFGGPFLSPTVFGAANPADPLFPFLGAFSNFAFASQEATLPLGEPLLAIIEHRPADDVVVVSVHRLLGGRRVLPVPGAVTVIPLDSLSVRDLAVDTIGLTLWHDGFSGPTPSVHATLTYHALLFRSGDIDRPEMMLSVPPTRP